jgi:hypothetical protein
MSMIVLISLQNLSCYDGFFGGRMGDLSGRQVQLVSNAYLGEFQVLRYSMESLDILEYLGVGNVDEELERLAWVSSKVDIGRFCCKDGDEFDCFLYLL